MFAHRSSSLSALYKLHSSEKFVFSTLSSLIQYRFLFHLKHFALFRLKMFFVQVYNVKLNYTVHIRFIRHVYNHNQTFLFFLLYHLTVFLCIFIYSSCTQPCIFIAILTKVIVLVFGIWQFLVFGFWTLTACICFQIDFDAL